MARCVKTHCLKFLKCLVIILPLYVCNANACQQNCTCSPTVYIDSEYRSSCVCSENGIIPENILQNSRILELRYSQPIVLRAGNVQKFNQLIRLNISGMQFVKPGGFQGLETLKRLVLYDNSMRVLEMNVFCNLQNLTNLELEGRPTNKNKLHALENGTFLGLRNLKHLYLKSNALADISEEYFRDLESLDYLDCSDNLLVQVKACTFIHAPLLTKLNLSKNIIREVHQHAFAGLTKLDTLILDGNMIKGMPQPLFSIGSLEEFQAHRDFLMIKLDDNPLRCDCHLNWLSSWLESSSCVGSCKTPDNLHGQLLEPVYRDGLPQCQPNNTVQTVEPGKQLELTCSFTGASWKTPDRRHFREHGDCGDPFCLTNRDSLVIWRTTPELSGKYTCLSSDGTQALYYQVHVSDTNSFTIAVVAGIAASAFLLIVLITVAGFKLSSRGNVSTRVAGNSPPGTPTPSSNRPDSIRGNDDRVFLLNVERDRDSSLLLNETANYRAIFKKDSSFDKKNINIYNSTST
ncbi:slit homolog 3 protein-like [Lytechinus pictus]|uniref:slit homolog 3 protein-like n=1 Tax=Lytechinus pictus TaxID=7653 RepID=UPI0030B9BA90